MAKSRSKSNHDGGDWDVLILGLRLVVSAISLGIAGVAGIIAVAALSGQPDNSQATNIEIGLVAAAVCLAALAALVMAWRK